MRSGKSMFKVFSVAIVVTIMLALMPSNVSAHPLDLSGVDQLGNKVVKIAQDIGKALSGIKISFSNDGQKQEQQIDQAESPSGKVVVSAAPDKDTEIQSPSGKVTLKIPAGAVNKQTDIEFDEYGAQESTGMVILNSFDLSAKETVSGTVVSKFNKNLQISIKHDPGELAGVDPQSVRLYYQDEETKQWVPVTSSKYDSKTDMLTATTDHFSDYSVQGNLLQVGPGRIMASQVNLNSGAATFSYSVELPPGPGGFQPKLDLNYNSASVDEMKNKQDVGSWVGIGWNLNFGSISCSMITDSYYLDLNGVSYELIPTDETQTNYRTNPEQFYKITRSGNYWTVIDRDGTLYQFGYTFDSEQYLPQEAVPQSNNVNCYRCDLNLIKDTNGNQATISYVQDAQGPSPDYWIRSAYPEYLNYGNVQVHFISSTGRSDDPPGYGSNPAPLIIENRKLNSIEIKVSGVLVRKYNFTYNTTSATYSSDYGGIYYAGSLSLTSLTQVGTDGSSQLPTMTFSYQNGHVYRKTNETYTGNPGDPSGIIWPFLTSINSGYGGTTSFSYTQIPDNSVYNTWSRQAVTTKTISGGIGPDETYQYAYTGNPQYNGTGWDQQFRGWNQVKETDAAGNYTIHWFYTTGTINGNDAEKLSGNEYKTEWYSSSNALLKRKTYNWASVITQNVDDHYVYFMNGPGTYTSRFNMVSGQQYPYNSYYFSDPQGIAVDSSGNTYVIDNGGPQNNCIYIMNSSGTYTSRLYGASGQQNFYYFNDLQGIAVDSSGNIYVLDNGGPQNNYVYVMNSSGTYTSRFNIVSGQQYPYNSYYFNDLQGIAVDSSGNMYVLDNGGPQNSYVYVIRGQQYTSRFNMVFGQQYPYNSYYFNDPQGIAVDSSGQIYVIDNGGAQNNYIYVTNSSGTYTSRFNIVSGQQYPYNSYYFNDLRGIAVDSSGNIYVLDSGGPQNNWVYVIRGQQYTSRFNMVSCQQYPYNSYYFHNLQGVACDNSNNSYRIIDLGLNMESWVNQLNQVDEIIGTKTSQTRYVYDSYGNIVTEYDDGDTSTTADDATIWRTYYPNTTTNILDKPARERTYATIVTSNSGGANLKKETDYYYDGNNTSLTTPPTKGLLTRTQQMIDASNSVSTYDTYDSYGNKLTEQDPNGNTTTWTYDSTYHTYPATKTDPISGLSESYTYDPGTNNLLTSTDVNGQTTTYQYDTFKRLVATIKPGDTTNSPSIQYQYNNWGTIDQQDIETITKINANTSTWQADYFDGVGRVVQTQAQSETTGHTFISSTTTFNNCGQVDKQYVSQDIASVLTSYQTPQSGPSGWKYSFSTYDVLGRVVTQTNADGTSTSNDYSQPWQTNTTNALGLITKYYYDAFNRLIQVQEPNSDNSVYATTNYTYDVLGNLTQVVDNNSNTTTMTYDWLSRKTGMTDPDMGSWSYGYDSNGNLTTQTDAKSQTITMVYDAMNRLTNKNYPAGSGMTNIVYTYDSTSGGNYGAGLRTGMTDAAGTTSDKYDNLGRLSEERKTINSVDYTTDYTYDGLDRVVTVTYPTGETVTNTYNGRGFGLPSTVSGSTVGSLVTSTVYNQLGSITQINLGNGLRTNYSYWGIDHSTTSYGKLWEITTLPQGGGTAIQDMQYTWDANGNLTKRQNLVSSETENFTYDSLDRLTAVSGAYSNSYAYNTIGDITSMNGTSYTYGNNQPQAVTAVGSTSYAYDANGNMTTRGNQTITWDVENRPVAVTGGATYVYDGDGNLVEKTENSQTTLYINQYYEKNITTGVVTTSYYLGGQLIAQNTGGTLKYIHQDSLGSTSVMSTSTGSLDSSIAYFPFGDCRNSQGTLGTDKLFTGQRLDATGLYYYNARYYDPTIGRFISADTAAPELQNPQSFNKYSYCFNNPLTFNDPTGQWPTWANIRAGFLGFAVRLFDTLTHPTDWVEEQIVNTATGPSGPKIDIVPSIVPVQYIDESQQFSYTMGRRASDVVVQAGITAGIGYASVSGSGMTGTVNNALMDNATTQGSTALYRAVNPIESADIQSNNMFNNLGYAEGKYFSLTEQGAASYAKAAYYGFGQQSTIVSTTIPTDWLSSDMFSMVDRSVPAVVVPDEMLPYLKPYVLNYSLIP